MMRRSAAAINIIIVLLLFQSVRSEFYPDERDALIQLRDIVKSPSSNLHANWTGVACKSENESRWAGVGCWDWHVAHLVLDGIQLTASAPLPPMLFHNLTFLTKLSFTNNSLHGPLPDLTNLVRLQYVFLSKNHFSGSIPFTYIDLPKLTKLELQENDLSGQIPPFNQQPLVGFNVSNNQLEGPIPRTGVLHRFPGSAFANNSGLCGDIPGMSPCRVPPPPVPVPAPSQPSRKKEGGGLQTWSIAVIAVLLPVSVIMLTCCYMRAGMVVGAEVDHIEDDGPERSGELEFFQSKRPMIFEVDDLLRSSAELIGRGKVGSTYKAVLECGSTVAVKRLEGRQATNKVKGKKEFAQQMQVVGNIKHHNLAEMISFYHSKEEKLIVYEYVADESLYSLLHESRGMQGGMVLDWNSRLGVIKEIAEGLEHLHVHGVLHGNLKSSNVLIQRSSSSSKMMMVKLTDYGLMGVNNKVVAVGRTPEYVEGKKVTIKADVYCLGILVLEMVTGRVAYNEDDDEDDDLCGWVREAVSNEWSTDIVDLQIVGEKDGYEAMLSLTQLALHCTDPLPYRRPTIPQILSTLQHLIIHHHH